MNLPKPSDEQNAIGMLNKEEPSMSASSPLAATGESPLPLMDFKNKLPHTLITQMGKLQRHILLVDDSDESRAMYGSHLMEKGYRVSRAHRGDEAFEMASRLGPDIILLHLWLPKINGWELTRLLKSDERTRHIPVLVLAGQTLVLPRECDGFLRKPFQLHELCEEIARRARALASVSPHAACG